jgi:hypothetical protein
MDTDLKTISEEEIRRALTNYRNLQKSKKTYYEAHKTDILAKKREKYAELNPEPKKKRKNSAEREIGL